MIISHEISLSPIFCSDIVGNAIEWNEISCIHSEQKYGPIAQHSFVPDISNSMNAKNLQAIGKKTLK